MTTRLDPKATGQAARSDPQTADEIRQYVREQLAQSDLPASLTDLPLSDAGNAEVLASLYGNILRFDHLQRAWLIWVSPRWARDENGEILRLALDSVRARQQLAMQIDDSDKRTKVAKWALASENRSRLDALMYIARAVNPIADPGNSWNPDPFLMGCTNGVVDLRTGELRPGTPGDRITLTTATNYNPSATAPRFTRFLSEIFSGDADLIEFIQRAAGYSLTGDTREQALFLCWGKGANGKSTLLQALRSVMGDYSENTPFSTFEHGQGYSGQTNDVAALVSKRFVTASETAESKRLNEARVKAVTGGDPVTARFLFGEYFTFTPSFKVWLAMNHKPVITGTDDGIWRRVRLVPFTVSFKGREEKTLVKTLESEREGILAWMVQGAKKWLADGLTEPKAVMAATEEYRAESDMIAIFLAECTTEQPTAETKAGKLYGAYESWCHENGEKSRTGNAFGREMRDRGYKAIKKGGMMWYENIGLTKTD